jgi:enoyl-[acyl-carrier-protein] reductase (NADH)
MPHYNVMGVAKAALEASVRYLALRRSRQEEVGGGALYIRSCQRGISAGADQDAGGDTSSFRGRSHEAS